MGNIHQIVTYLVSTYRKISPSHLNNFEEEVTDMHYDPVTPVSNIFNKIEELLEYRDQGKLSLFTPLGNLQGLQHP